VPVTGFWGAMRVAKPYFPIAVLLIFMTACGPDNRKPPPPAPKQEEPKETPLPPKPAPPQGTDFSKPGEHGRVGVDPPEPKKPDADVPVAGSDDAGGILGSSLHDQQYWDERHPFKECPEDPIYVFAASQAPSKPQCADGQGFAAVCNACEQTAYRRAVNVIRSCERAPSCRAEITQVGQKWACMEMRQVQGQDQSGKLIYGPSTWVKDCWTQYKVVCIKL
jgi:hypothetical protein